MDAQRLKRSRTLIGWICDLFDPASAPTRKRIFEIHLSTGETIAGELSPFDDESDYVRLHVPPQDGRGASVSHAVSLAHIVYVREKAT